MIKLKHDSATYTLPTSPKEVDLWQYQAMVQSVRDGRSDYIAIIGACTGLDDNAVLLSEGQADEFAYYLNTLAEAMQQWPEEEPLRELYTGGRKLTAPKDWGLARVGQRLAFQQHFDGQDVVGQMHIFLSILLSPSVYGDDWAEYYMDLAEELKQAPAYKAVPMAYFFLRRRFHLSKRGAIRWPSLLIHNLRTMAARQWRRLGFSMW